MVGLDGLYQSRSARVVTAGWLLSVYLVGMGWLIRLVPGLAAGGCPVGQPCDPLIVHPHSELGTALLILGITVTLVTLTVFITWTQFDGRGVLSFSRGSREGEVTASSRFRLLALLLYVAAALVVAVGAEGVILVLRSPVTCAPGPAPEFCPPSRVAAILLRVVGANVVAVASIGAARTLTAARR